MSGIERLFGWLKRTTPGGAVASAPEAYWVERKDDVIGRMTVEQLRGGRQAGTYRAVAKAVTDRAIGEVLDLGCNIAALGMMLFDGGYRGRYLGVDNNPYALEAARGSLGVLPPGAQFERANIRSLPLADKASPCVVMKDVLEHTEDFRPLLQEAARVAGQYLVVANFIPWTEGKTIIRREAEGYYHNLYNRREVYEFARGLGFEVEEALSALESDGRANEVVVFKRMEQTQVCAAGQDGG